MKLTAEQLHGVREWLKLPRAGQPHTCPFYDKWVAEYWWAPTGVDTNASDCYVTCPAIFKSLQKKRKTLKVFCPCKAYAHTYVVRKARLLLSRKGETNGGK
jgi:hypothetical protein